MSEEKTAAVHPAKATNPKGLDRKHWAARIGIPFGTLRDREFKKHYPFEPHLHNIDGRSYHFLDEGDGEPVVMVHGNPTWSFFYRKVVLGLREHHRCLVPDHLGCGLSEKPQNYTYDLEHHIGNLESWLESMLPPHDWNGGKINLIVHDWGGPIGLGYAVRHPKRIRRLVIMNTSAFLEGTMPRCIRMCRIPLLGEAAVRGFNAFAKGATVKTTVKPIHKSVKKGFLLPYNSWKNRVGIHNFIQDIPLKPGTRTHELLGQLDGCLEEKLAGKPMLIQWGMQDWCFTPAFLEMWKQRFPDAEIDEYNAGHYLLEDAYKEIVPRIRTFLQRPCE